MLEQEKKSCFIITPIGDLDSPIFRKINGVITSTIRPVLQEMGFGNISAAHEINKVGSINTQIINRIVYDDLVIANLTENNPNVMYELCLRHVAAKPIIHICEKGTALPFDIKDNRTIFYENDMLGVEELKGNLKKYLNEIDYKKEYIDNPVYLGLQIGSLLKTNFIGEHGENDKELIKKIYDKIFPRTSEHVFLESKGFNTDSDSLVNVKWKELLFIFDENMNNEKAEFLDEVNAILKEKGIYHIETTGNVEKYVANRDVTYGSFRRIVRKISIKYRIELVAISMINSGIV